MIQLTLPYSLGPKQIERMLKTQEIKTQTLPLDFSERTNEGHSALAYNTLLVSVAFIIAKSGITQRSFYNLYCVLLIILIGNLPSNFYHSFILYICNNSISVFSLTALYLTSRYTHIYNKVQIQYNIIKLTYTPY